MPEGQTDQWPPSSAVQPGVVPSEAAAFPLDTSPIPVALKKGEKEGPLCLIAAGWKAIGFQFGAFHLLQTMAWVRGGSLRRGLSV